MSTEIDDLIGHYEEDALDSFEREFGKQGFWKPKPGENMIRLLPPTKGMKLPFAPSYQHFYEIPGRDQSVIHNCPRRMARQRCPTCEEIEVLARTGNKVDLQMAERMAASYRAYARIIDRAEPDKGIQIYAFGWGVQQDINLFLRDHGNFTHPLNGIDTRIRRKGTKKHDTKYRLDPGPKCRLAETDEEVIAILTAAVGVDLERCSLVPTYEQCRLKVTGGTDDGGGNGGGRRALPSGGDGDGGGAWDDASVGDAIDSNVHNDDIPY